MIVVIARATQNLNPPFLTIGLPTMAGETFQNVPSGTSTRPLLISTFVVPKCVGGQTEIDISAVDSNGVKSAQGVYVSIFEITGNPTIETGGSFSLTTLSQSFPVLLINTQGQAQSGDLLLASYVATGPGPNIGTFVADSPPYTVLLEKDDINNGFSYLIEEKVASTTGIQSSAPTYQPVIFPFVIMAYSGVLLALITDLSVSADCFVYATSPSRATSLTVDSRAATNLIVE